MPTNPPQYQSWDSVRERFREECAQRRHERQKYSDGIEMRKIENKIRILRIRREKQESLCQEQPEEKLRPERIMARENEDLYEQGKSNMKENKLELACISFHLASAWKMKKTAWDALKKQLQERIDRIPKPRDNLASVTNSLQSFLEIGGILSKVPLDPEQDDHFSHPYSQDGLSTNDRHFLIYGEHLHFHQYLATLKKEKQRLELKDEKITLDVRQKEFFSRVTSDVHALDSASEEANQMLTRYYVMRQYALADERDIRDLEKFLAESRDKMKISLLLQKFSETEQYLTKPDLYDNIVGADFSRLSQIEAALAFYEQLFLEISPYCPKLSAQGLISATQEHLFRVKQFEDVFITQSLSVVKKNLNVKMISPDAMQAVSEKIKALIADNDVSRCYLSISQENLHQFQEKIIEWMSAVLERKKTCFSIFLSDVATLNTRKLNLEKSMFIAWMCNPRFVPG